jgi:nucleotide-binding universal stress UspA family protein
MAAEEGVAFAKQRGAELVLLHVIEHFPEHLPHYQIAHEEMDPQEFIIDRAQKDLVALGEKLGMPEAVKEVRLTTHSAKSEIIKFATDAKVNLIVIGARGRHSLIDILSGSTATGVVRIAPCSVFVVHDDEAGGGDKANG